MDKIQGRSGVESTALPLCVCICVSRLEPTLEPVWNPPWNPFGTHLELVWNPFGTRLELVWNPFGTHLEPVWGLPGRSWEPTLEPVWNPNNYFGILRVCLKIAIVGLCCIELFMFHVFVYLKRYRAISRAAPARQTATKLQAWIRGTRTPAS